MRNETMIKGQYRLKCRVNGVFYAIDRKTLKQESLNTKNPEEAERLLAAKNEATRAPEVNYQIAMAYLTATDPTMSKRRWQDVFEAYAHKLLLASDQGKESPTYQRGLRAAGDKAFDAIRKKRLVATTSEDFMNVLRCGKVSTNMFLRRFHNFALGMNWLPKAVMSKQVWPKVRHSKKRAIAREEHLAIIAAERNSERRLFYDFLWETGAAQGDAAILTAHDVNWEARTVSFQRAKRKSAGDGYAVIQIGTRLEAILRQLPDNGQLFPYLATVRSGDRATEFHQRCELLGIKGISLHCYRYAWAKRAKEAGYPQRFAMAQLGHGCKAIHEAYARDAVVACPPLEQYDSPDHATVVPFPSAA